MMKTWVLVKRMLLLMCCLFKEKFYIIHEATADLVENWPRIETTVPRLKQVLAGKDVILGCAGHIGNASAHWEYKPCGSSLRIPCAEVIANEKEGPILEEWIPLSSNKTSFMVSNAQYTDSGLYRCREAASHLIINVYSTIELEVINYTEEEDGELPQFLDGLPSNFTVMSNTQKVFQCKVSSRSPPTIVWLFEGLGPLKYRGQSYTPVNSSGEMKLSGNVYLSKMMIRNAENKHAGRYYCVALNTKGFSNMSMLLNIAYTNVVDIDSDNLFRGPSLYFLFLIPVALASFPLSIWLCFICLRRNVYSSHYTDKKEDNNEDIIYRFDSRKQIKGYSPAFGQIRAMKSV